MAETLLDGSLRGNYPGPVVTPDANGRAVLCEGRFTRYVSKKGWECIERKNCAGVVGVFAVTRDDCVLLVEQFRAPFDKNTLEIPAGLVGDGTGDDSEKAAAERELIEETGYKPGILERMFNGPTSTGISAETITLFAAFNCDKIDEGGGVDGENIIVHKVPFDKIDSYLKDQETLGKIIDLKVRLLVPYWAWVRANAILRKGLSEYR